MFVHDSDASHVDEARILVFITDANDNAPVFDAGVVSLTVAENEALGRTLTRFTAIDADSSNNKNNKFTFVVSHEPLSLENYWKDFLISRSRYSIDPDSHPDYWFSIDANSGLVKISGILDREGESGSTLHVKVLATDQGSIKHFCSERGLFHIL